MSAGRWQGLPEFNDYKNQLMNDLLTNEEIALLLSDDCKSSPSPEELMYSQVFPYEYVPDVVEHGQTFICSEVDIKEVTSKTFLTATLYIWVFTHKSKVRLPQGGVRTDKLASEIVKTINGSRMYGLGTLELRSVKRFAPITNYQGRILTFETDDYNRLSPSKRPIPENRKRG